VLRRISRSFILFCLIGGLNTLLDIGLFLALQQQGMPIVPANILSTSAALLMSYALNKRFTFGASGQSNRAFIPFVVVTLVGLWLLQPVVIYVVGQGLTAFTHDHELLRNLAGKLAATAVTMVWNYVLYKKYVFRPVTRPTEDIQA
jgi:putative flippase GtrA